MLTTGKSDKRMTEIQDQKGGQVSIGQPADTKSILSKFGMDNAKPANTPVDVSAKLVKATDDSERIDQVQYRSAVGRLLYLSTKTRPEITYAVSNVAIFCAEPTKQHWTAVKRIMRYLNGTPEQGLFYSKGKNRKCVG